MIPSNNAQGFRVLAFDGNCCVFIREGVALATVVGTLAEDVGASSCGNETAVWLLPAKGDTLQ
jgi:hypothetical protein